MGRLFFVLSFLLLTVAFLLFFPIILDTDIHGDINKRKLTFLLRLFGKIKILGGYITTYKGGIAFHINERKAILKPYKQMNEERKRFSFLKSFRPIEFTLTMETGAEYLFYVAIVQAILRIYFFAIGGAKEKIENNVWLTDGDVLRVSLHSAIFFNGYILLCNFIKFLRGKIVNLCLKRKKKSIV